MQPDVKRLIEVQATDLRLAALRSRLEAMPQQLAAVEQRIADAKKHLAGVKDALTQSLKDRKTFEMDVESWKEKARRYRDQSFAVKTNEAYKALQHEIEHAEGEAARAEDRLLERMVSGEEFDRQVKTSEQELTLIEREAAKEHARIKAEQEEVQKEFRANQAERHEKVAAVPEDLYQNYQKIAGRRHGIGMAAVRGDESCSQCGVIIRPHVFQALRRPENQEIFQCETCTRILYYDEPAPPADVLAGAAGGS